MSEVAIRVDDVSKLYKLYDKPSEPTEGIVRLDTKEII